MSKIKISAVSYTNTLPFLQGINASNIINDIELTVDYPAECARKVIENEVDLGIIPVAALLSIADPYIISDFCIGTKDYVDSVFIFSSVPIQEIKTLRLDQQSKTSNGLAQILLKYYWKRDVQVITEGEADAYVLIGDRTFGQKNNIPFVYDLGHFWKEFTGLEFAFAVWVANKKLPEQFVTDFNRALADGVSHPQDVIDGLPPYADFDYLHYLTVNLDFKLTEEKKKSITKYLEWYKTL